MKIQYLFKYNMLTSVSIKQALGHIGIKNILFKWPNDVYCDGKKLSGIIQESYLDKLKKQILIIGVGINVSSNPKNLLYKTCSINKYVKDIDYIEFFKIFLNYFLKNFHDFTFKNKIKFINEYKNNQMLMNTNIKIKLNNKQTISGLFSNINEDGSLMLIKENKKLPIYFGKILI